MNATLYEGYIIVTVDEKDVSTPDIGIRVCEKLQQLMEEFKDHLDETAAPLKVIRQSKDVTQERMNALCKD